MSGHSQFANIMHRKGAQDKKRGKVFQKIVREISVAVKASGTNIDSNAKLRLVLDKAKAFNMPKDIVNRAISKAANQNDQSKYEDIIYEGYGPGGTAIIVHCLTDNKNRTASNIRSYFNKCNGKLGLTNSVQYLFTKQGVLEFSSDYSLETIIDAIIDYDVINWFDVDGDINLTVNSHDLAVISNLLQANNFVKEFFTNDVQNVASEKITVDEAEIKSLSRLLDLLNDDEDVVLVEDNWNR